MKPNRRDPMPMRYKPVDPQLFRANRGRLKNLILPNSLVVVNANDILPTNADGTLAMVPGSDLFYLSGIEQEQSILLLYPEADDEKHREILFLRQPTPEMEVWEGQKLSKAEARARSGIAEVRWLSEFPQLFHRLMCECEYVYLNSNEHKRAVIEVETREARFVAETQQRYPLHAYRRLAPLMHRLRAVKNEQELLLILEASKLTEEGFRRVLRFIRPGVREVEIEAEFAHEFIRAGGRFAYQPIIGAGINACCLHYVANSQVCKSGDLVLLDVGASYANYNADMTRTVPVNGRFTRRQRRVYDSVLKVLRQCIKGLQPGKKPKEWQDEAEELVEKELVDLGLLSLRQIKRQDSQQPARKKYFMHGVGHPLGLDVHDVGLTTEPFQAGWVMTVEPGIYIPEEGFAVRLENDVLITEQGPVDLMDTIPIDPDEIEALMNRRPRRRVARNGRNGVRAALPPRHAHRLAARAS